MIKKSFKNSNEQLFEIKANNDILQVNETKINWNEIIEAISLEDGFILYYGNAYIFIPKDSFSSTDEKDSFSHLLKDSIENYSKDT